MGKHLNVKGFYPAVYTGGKCTACKACGLICPDICIEIFKLAARGGASMKVLMKGNEALSEAAIRAGATLYFGYPITPQNEVGEYMSRRLPTIPGGAFIQAETEVASINMVYGAVVHRAAGR